MSTAVKIALYSMAAIAVAGLVLAFLTFQREDTRAYAVPEFEPMTSEQLAEESFLVMPEMLATIYRAFGETDEAVIYDKLAEVAAGDALETLYLERVGAMVGGGLEKADQTLHAMDLKSLSSRHVGTTFTMNIKWIVVGTVGHATHLHVRGNTYSANLVVEPVKDAWRLTSFDLTDVDRTDAGTQVAAE